MQLGWIDFSKEERNKVLSVIHLLEESETVDELGLGAVRDGFADYFFPGTSTVQTRAKYFLVVPYILNEVVAGKYGSEVHGIIEEIDNEERACRDILLKHSTDGVIGRLEPDSWVQRAPSSIYWNGLKKYGILTTNVSLKKFIQLSINQRLMKERKILRRTKKMI